MIGQYVYNVALAVDRLGNAALGGDPDWTLSQRMGQAIRQNRCWGCYWICRALDLIDRHHCSRAFDPDKPAEDRLIGARAAFVAGVGLLAMLAWAIV